MRIRIKKLHEDAVIPKYQTEGAAGFDFHSLEDHTIYPGNTTLIDTGLAFEIPEGYELQVRPRSGMSLKTSLRVANSPGSVDSDFRGSVKIIAHNSDHDCPQYGGGEKIFIKKGDRIAQGMICPVIRASFLEVEELNETDRGDKGFGSTNA